MKIRVKRKINAPSDVLWSYLGDYSNIHRFHPMLKGSHFTEENTTCEVGSTRQCDFKDGNYLKERIIDWKEGSHYTVDIYGTSMPIKSAQATLGLKSIGENQTDAYMHVEMTSKYFILKPLMYFMFQFITAPSILKGLEKLYQSESLLKIANV